MAWLRSGNWQMMDVERRPPSWATLWQSASSSVASRTNRPSLPPPCSRTFVIVLLSSSLPVTCLAVCLSVSRHLLLSLPVPFLPRSPHACLCFYWAALLSPCNLSLVIATSGKHWTSGCCLVPTHVDLRHRCQVAVWRSFGCQDIWFCLLQLIHALLQGLTSVT